jgi:hypothetical protein
MSVDQVKTIRPTGIGLLGRVAELINDRRNLDAKFSHARAGDHRAFLFILGAGENDFVFNIALHLPNVAGMRFRDVHNQEVNLISILLIKLIESGNLPPEGRSRVAAKNQHHWPALRRQS